MPRKKAAGKETGIITLYALPGCPFCERARSFLEQKGLPFTEVPVEPGSAGYQAMVEETGGMALPQVMAGDRRVGGYGDLVEAEATGALYEWLGMPAPGREIHAIWDTVVLGAGPAGLSAALYAARKMMKVVLVSRDVGGQVGRSYDIENYLGFPRIETAELIGNFEKHLDRYRLEKDIGQSVVSLRLGGRIKHVVLENGRTYFCRTLIVATGKRSRKLNIPGEAGLVGRGVSYCSTCDAPLFAGEKTAVVGGGNSAVEAVIDLLKVADHITLVSTTPLTADPVLIQRIVKQPKVKILTGHEPVAITGNDGVTRLTVRNLVTGRERKLAVTGVFVEIGLLPNSELFVDVLSTNRLGEILVDSNCRTGMAGVFACGDVTQVPYKQVIIAAGEGAKAALSAHEYLLVSH